MLLNTKSITVCDEIETEIHNQEIQLLMDFLTQFMDDYPCAVLMNGEPFVEEEYSLYDCIDVIQYCDIKNGIDLKIGDNNVFQIICYGNDFNNPTVISILPYDENRDFLDISSHLKMMFEKAIIKASTLN